MVETDIAFPLIARHSLPPPTVAYAVPVSLPGGAHLRKTTDPVQSQFYARRKR